MAVLHWSVLQAVRQFLSDEQATDRGPMTIEEKQQLLMGLTCGFHEATLLFQIHSDTPGEGFPVLYRCISASASQLSQLLGHLSRGQDVAATIADAVPGVEVLAERLAEDQIVFKQELFLWIESIVQWMSRANVTGHNSAERVIEAILFHLAPATRYVRSEVALEIMNSFCSVRARVLNIQASQTNEFLKTADDAQASGRT